MNARKCGANRWTKRLRRGGRPHAAGRLIAVVSEPPAERLHLLEDAIHVLEHGLSSLGEPHAVPRPDEQRLAELLLQRLDLVAHGRLRHVQPRRRAREARGLGHGAKRAQLRKSNAITPQDIRLIMSDIKRMMLFDGWWTGRVYVEWSPRRFGPA